MKWCRFQSGEKTAYGIIEADTVIEATGSPFDHYTRTSTTYSLSAVKLLVPVIPPTFYAAGMPKVLYSGNTNYGIVTEILAPVYRMRASSCTNTIPQWHGFQYR